MGGTTKFKLPAGYDQKQLTRELTDQYTIRQETPRSAQLTFYDTFDWRLFNKSLVLYTCESRLYLRRLFSNQAMHALAFDEPPTFIWHFSDGGLKAYLAPIIKMRALSKLVEAHALSTPFRILNRDQKTVTRLLFQEIRTSQEKEALATYLWLTPVKGYPKYRRRLSRRFEEAGFGTGEKEDVYFMVLGHADINPGSYSAKLNIRLEPDMRADEATKIILRSLLDVIRINEPHIASDIDTEFLHDFRVSIRRTRTALGQIKAVFSGDVTDRFKKDFSFVGKITNQLRDLDVYLLDENRYKAMLPDDLSADIHPLFDYLRRERAAVLKEAVKELRSEKYRRIMTAWESFLDRPVEDDRTAPSGDVPILDVARKRIYNRYRKIAKAGNRIIERTQDDLLHDLRIECKKLRYLMEFFSSLFPPKKIGVLIRQLKKLQDNLGDFNDFCVQRDYLLDTSAKLAATDQLPKTTYVAIGCLVGVLESEKQAVKSAFADTFKKYASPGNRQLFKELFASK